jgi:phospholipase C
MTGLALRIALMSLVAFAGCSSSQATTPARVVPESAHAKRATPIRHIVVIVQENRSFDNFFAGYPGADSTMTGRTHDGKAMPLKPIAFARLFLGHFWRSGLTDWNKGAMNGFDLVTPEIGSTKYTPYSYVERQLVAPYWQMAQQYVLADHMFPTEFGPSFTAHLNLIAGSTAINATPTDPSGTRAVADYPQLDGVLQFAACDSPPGTRTNLITSQRQYLSNGGPFPCFSFPTLADALDQAGISWKYYVEHENSGRSLWNSFQAIRSVRFGSDWKNNIATTNGQVLTDAANGNLPAVSWVTPTQLDSDHPGAGSDTGPSWVAAVVNAIGTGPQWSSTAIIVLWDDWGGWYDNVPPPQLDYRGLGLRVPCIIISPYAKTGYVEHEPFEFGSILRTIEKVYGLRQIGTTDSRAYDMLDAFDFTQSPRKFKPISAKYPIQHFLREPVSNLDLDD